MMTLRLQTISSNIRYITEIRLIDSISKCLCKREQIKLPNKRWVSTSTKFAQKSFFARLNLTQQTIGTSSMNQVRLSTTAGKLFWLSLIGYCVAFGGFFFTTQYTLSRIDFEEQHGAFLGFKEAICSSGKNCSDIKFENTLIDTKRKYSTFVDVQYAKLQPIDVTLLQKNYADFVGTLPWYVRIQFSASMEIKSINGKPFKENNHA